MHQEVEKFKAWANTYTVEERTGEWECDYDEWDKLYHEVLSFLESSEVDNWSESDINDILYAVARDNEIEYLVSEFTKKRDMLIRVAGLALSSSEPAAKWQLASELGKLSDPVQEVEKLLLKFIEDEDEYVNRRALIALGAINSPAAEALAEQAWHTGHEYQRIASLWVMKEVGSPKLPQYLQLAFADGRQYIWENANKITQMSE